MDEPVRVAMIMGKMVGGGVESVVMNYYRCIDRTKIQFDFIIDNDSTIIPEEEIISMGGRIYKVSPYQRVFSYMKDIKKIFEENNYKIVHSHINTLSVIPLLVAKKCLIPIRIAHNHSTIGRDDLKKNVIKYGLRVFSTMFPTHYIAPIYKTGEWLFGSKVAKNELFILPNAFKINNFTFNDKARVELRKKLGYLEKDFVLGSVGRIVHSKNHIFIIRILKKIYKDNPNIKLLIIGDGPLKKEIEQVVRDLNLEKIVTIVSNVVDIENYYMVMDLFLFPSYYEGLGLAGVEAQASGLPIIASDTLPTEINITCDYYKTSLNDMESWINRINAIIDSKTNRKLDISEKLKIRGYDIDIEAKNLVDYYYNILTLMKLN